MNRSAGVICLKPGERVAKGRPLSELHADEVSRFSPALAALAEAAGIGSRPPAVRRAVIDQIGV